MSDEVQVAVLTQKMVDFERLVLKLDETIIKMSEVNTNVSRVLGIHEERISQQEKIDEVLLKLDGSENKTKLGANATLAVSLANSKCSAISGDKSLYKNFGNTFLLPVPLMNIINGGAHANNSLEIQEFMIRPDGANSFKDCMRMSYLVVQNLKKNLEKLNISTSVGDEGGFAPSLKSAKSLTSI